MTLLNPTTNAPAPEADAALTQALSAFDTPVVAGTATNLLKTAAAVDSEPTSAILDVAETEEEPTTEAAETSEEETAEEEEAEDSAFAVEFEQEFGMKPNEAIELVQELQGFRQELSLMREWQVSPVEYDSRMTKVKEFYGTLPEGEREKFNSPEGAKAIWNHLSKSQPKAEAKSRRAARTTARTTPQVPKAELIQRSEILAMDEATYRRELPRITRAFREGRVVD